MSRAHPSLAPLGVRLAALGHATLAHDVAHLGSSLSSESASVGCWTRTVALLETAARAAAEQADEIAGLTAMALQLRRELAAAKGAA